MALLPEADHYGFVWTTTPAQGEALLALPDAEFTAALERRLGACLPGNGSPEDSFVRVAERRASL
jgi:2-polyprenyl-6-methoxyphenol hydroxylase-like FAD-dependent oxidoreductase